MISSLISTIISIIQILILVECVLSWFIRDDSNDIMNALRILLSPILEPFRKIQYRYFVNLPIELSPVFAYISLSILRRLVYIIL